MSLPLHSPFPPMEALSVDHIPEGPEWQYEPKWDGFRCVAYKDGDHIELQSKAGQPLARYFPDIVAALKELAVERCVLDGELVIPTGDVLSFDQLQLRLHPAASRVNKLAAEHPALLIVFDLLVDDTGESLIDRPLAQRRPRLEDFAQRFLAATETVRLSPATDDLETGRGWFAQVGGSMDGIMAKRLDLPYRSGERTGMQKIKSIRSADCVIGGFRYGTGLKVVGSLLLGLFDDTGALNNVGFCSSFKHSERQALTERLEPLRGTAGFTGKSPGGPSRWNKGQATEWEPLRPELVIEVSYDHFTGGRFRHGTNLLRWRPDKAPAQCTMDQVLSQEGHSLRLLD